MTIFLEHLVDSALGGIREALNDACEHTPTHTSLYQRMLPDAAIFRVYLFTLSLAQILCYKANFEILYRYNPPNDQNSQILCP